MSVFLSPGKTATIDGPIPRDIEVAKPVSQGLEESVEIPHVPVTCDSDDEDWWDDEE